MEYQAPKSKCNLCNKEFAGRGLARHIKACIPKKLSDNAGKEHLYVVVQDLYNHDYFFHLLLSPTTTLKDIDEFLRRKWLECCGHLSAFTYARYGQEIPKSRKAHQVLSPGTAIEYQYDFGSTTELTIKCMGDFTVPAQGRKKIHILAQNSPPLIPCDVCEQYPATQICTACQWDGSGWLCEHCAAEHNCEDEAYFLPVVNSPRTGVCGYTGG